MKTLKKDKKGRIIIPDEFPRIAPNELNPFDIFQYYNGNWWTETHGEKWQQNKYGRSTKAPFHTNGEYDEGVNFKKHFLMDTEVRNTGSLLEAEYMTKKSVRIDVIRRKDLTQSDKKQLAQLIEEELGSERYYGVLRFGSFAKRMKYVGWMFKWMKPSNKQVVCSGRWAKAFQTIKKRISPYGYNETIPNDITVYAMRHPELFAIRTLKKGG